MGKSLRVLIHGASGRMGRAVARIASADSRVRIVAGVCRSASGGSLRDVPVITPDELPRTPEFDVAIDFSLPDGALAVLSLCESRGCALVSGTTGFDDTGRARFDAGGDRIALLWAANFSLGVAVLTALIERAAAALPQWDADIVESHHVHKKDAPSGTALALGAAVERGRGRAPHYASLRAGDIVGEHLVQLTGQGERIELTHRATDRDVFARGALEAALRLAGRPPGRYALADLLLKG